MVLCLFSADLGLVSGGVWVVSGLASGGWGCRVGLELA